MKLLIVFALCVAAASAFSLGAEWEKFKATFNKSYELGEEIRRVKTFYFNLARIAAHNAQYKAGLQTYHLALNEFADWTQTEFDFWRKGFMKAPTSTGNNKQHVVSGTTLPDSVDWRDQGLVTDVKNQGQCGSCWSFSTTGSVEGQLMKQTGTLTSLSEQNLVDCSGDYGNQGCNGGLMDQAFQYIRDNGIMSEADYPYTGTTGTCQADSSKVVTKVSGFVDVASGDEGALQDAVANVGPISVAIDASPWSFQFYSGGVYSSIFCSSTSLDHGVLAVGYGTDSSSGKNYWLVKNSWGTTWGEKGFFKLLRKNNECGIATQASYPEM